MTPRPDAQPKIRAETAYEIGQSHALNGKAMDVYMFSSIQSQQEYNAGYQSELQDCMSSPGNDVGRV